MFLDRDAELAFLRSIQTRSHPGPGQFIMLYGRRRVGKTALLLHWAEQSSLPFSYFAAEDARRQNIVLVDAARLDQELG